MSKTRDLYWDLDQAFKCGGLYDAMRSRIQRADTWECPVEQMREHALDLVPAALGRAAGKIMARTLAVGGICQHDAKTWHDSFVASFKSAACSHTSLGHTPLAVAETLVVVERLALCIPYAAPFGPD